MDKDKFIDNIYFWFFKYKTKHTKKMNRKTRNEIINSIANYENTNTVIYDSQCDINYSFEEIKEICQNPYLKQYEWKLYDVYARLWDYNRKTLGKEIGM